MKFTVYKINLINLILLLSLSFYLTEKHFKRSKTDVTKQINLLKEKIEDKTFKDNLLLDKNNEILRKYIQKGILNFSKTF